jgi:hypothetical protein
MDKAAVAAVQEFRSQVESVQAAVVRQVGEILSRRQKRAFNLLLGKPFDLAGVQPGDTPRGVRAGENLGIFGGAVHPAPGRNSRASQPTEESPLFLEPISPAAPASTAPK